LKFPLKIMLLGIGSYPQSLYKPQPFYQHSYNTALAMSDGQVFHRGNISFMSSLLASQKATIEEPVQILWTTILTTWFPTIEPYKLAFKSPITQNDLAPDGIVIEIRFTPRAASRPGGHQVNSSHDLQEFQIFFVECKRPQNDTPAEWDAARVQLCQYFEMNINYSSKMYGAIGIGTKVVFYEWNESASPQLQPLHASTIDLLQPAGRVELEALLKNVKLNGWNLASLSLR
jgi:hypothetical protein